MLRFLGILCLMTGFCGLSVELVKEEKEKIKSLKDIRDFGIFLLREIQYSHIPIPDICREYIGRSNGRLKSFLEMVCFDFDKNEGQSFETVWLKASEKISYDQTRFYGKREDIKWLCRLNNGFGYSNLGMQQTGIEQYLDDLDKFIIQKEKKFQDNKKLILYFGVMSGLLLSIILL